MNKFIIGAITFVAGISGGYFIGRNSVKGEVDELRKLVDELVMCKEKDKPEPEETPLSAEPEPELEPEPEDEPDIAVPVSEDVIYPIQDPNDFYEPGYDVQHLFYHSKDKVMTDSDNCVLNSAAVQHRIGDVDWDKHIDYIIEDAAVVRNDLSKHDYIVHYLYDSSTEMDESESAYQYLDPENVTDGDDENDAE